MWWQLSCLCLVPHVVSWAPRWGLDWRWLGHIRVVRMAGWDRPDDMMFPTHGSPVAQSMCELCRRSQEKPRINGRQHNGKNKNWMVSRCSSQWMSIQRTSKARMRKRDSFPNYSQLAGNILIHDTVVCPTAYKIGDNVWSSRLRKIAHHLDQLNSLSFYRT